MLLLVQPRKLSVASPGVPDADLRRPGIRQGAPLRDEPDSHAAHDPQRGALKHGIKPRSRPCRMRLGATLTDIRAKAAPAKAGTPQEGKLILRKRMVVYKRAPQAPGTQHTCFKLALGIYKTPPQ